MPKQTFSNIYIQYYIYVNLHCRQCVARFLFLCVYIYIFLSLCRTLFIHSTLIRKIILHKIMAIFGSLREKGNHVDTKLSDKEKNNIQLSQIMCTNKNSIEKIEDITVNSWI